MEYNQDSYNDDSIFASQNESNPVLKNVRVENIGGAKTFQRKKRLTGAIVIRVVIMVILIVAVFVSIKYVQVQRKNLDNSLLKLSQATDKIRVTLTTMKVDDPIAADTWKSLPVTRQNIDALDATGVKDAFNFLLNKYHIRNAVLQVQEFTPFNNSAIKKETIQSFISEIKLSFKIIDDSYLYDFLDEIGHLDDNRPGILVFSSFNITRNVKEIRYYDEIRISEGALDDYALQVDLVLYWYNLGNR